MGRSMFLIGSQRANVNRLQFRKLRDELGSQSLLLEGTCTDKRNAIEGLVEDVRRRMKFGPTTHPVMATLATMVPQNMPRSEDSWLKVPFVVGRSCNGLDAGSIACSEPVDYDSGPVRKADLGELTLLTMAVLRNFDINAHYAYLHLDQNHPMIQLVMRITNSSPDLVTPCVILPESKEIVTMTPPFVMNFGEHPVSSSIEVLDDRALLSLLKIKAAHGAVLDLMHEVKTSQRGYGEALIPDFDELSAISIGHLMFSGITEWTLQEVKNSMEAASMLFNIPVSELNSIRTLYEAEQVHKIRCFGCHGYMAAENILCDNLKSELVETLQSREVEVVDLLRSIEGHPCTRKFARYMDLGSVIQQHLHDGDSCQAMGMSN